MEENKDDYLKKKLHIKDRFIKRLETEKRQLEIDNNTLKHRLGLTECRLDSLTRIRKKAVGEGLQTNDHQQTPIQGSQRISVESQSMAGSVLPRYIPFPNSCTSSLEVARDLLHERIPMPSVTVGQDVKNDQLLNENLKYALEISYLKARLKSSDAARTVAERTIENLEEKLRHLEKAFGREVSDNVENVGQDRNGSHPFPSHSPQLQAKPSSDSNKNYEAIHPSDVYTHSKSERKESTVVNSTLMTCLNRILQVVISLDEKMNHIQKDCGQRHPLEITS